MFYIEKSAIRERIKDTPSTGLCSCGFAVSEARSRRFQEGIQFNIFFRIVKFFSKKNAQRNDNIC